MNRQKHLTLAAVCLGLSFLLTVGFFSQNGISGTNTELSLAALVQCLKYFSIREHHFPLNEQEMITKGYLDFQTYNHGKRAVYVKVLDPCLRIERKLLCPDYAAFQINYIKDIEEVIDDCGQLFTQSAKSPFLFINGPAKEILPYTVYSREIYSILIEDRKDWPVHRMDNHLYEYFQSQAIENSMQNITDSLDSYCELTSLLASKNKTLDRYRRGLKIQNDTTCSVVFSIQDIAGLKNLAWDSQNIGFSNHAKFIEKYMSYLEFENLRLKIELMKSKQFPESEISGYNKILSEKEKSYIDNYLREGVWAD
ncbi:MAG TPA: hypothetical protein PKB02_03305 [Anaerohalosphaeraceae bacterium]|nr:hypothetical protein [Anaerohalosphaeraceae bacterium]